MRSCTVKSWRAFLSRRQVGVSNANGLEESRTVRASGAGTGFSVTGPSIGHDSLLIGVGVLARWNDRFGIFAYYDGEVGRANYDSQSVSAGIRVFF